MHRPVRRNVSAFTSTIILPRREEGMGLKRLHPKPGPGQPHSTSVQMAAPSPTIRKAATGIGCSGAWLAGYEERTVRALHK